MASADILCSERECKKRIVEARSVDLQELVKLVDKCNGCGDWLIKTNEVATKTANEIASLYAIRFNEARFLK